jgi:protein-tyrosine phosphatase
MSKNQGVNRENDVDEILPKLFLGNAKSSYDDKFLTMYKIKYIIRVMYEFDFSKKRDDIIYFHIEIRDSKTCASTKDSNPYLYQRIFGDATDLINKLRIRIAQSTTPDSAILIHCKRGHHRSASIAAAYLVRYQNFTFTNAIDYIKSIRPNSLKKNTCIMYELYKYCSSPNCQNKMIA